VQRAVELSVVHWYRPPSTTDCLVALLLLVTHRSWCIIRQMAECIESWKLIQKSPADSITILPRKSKRITYLSTCFVYICHWYVKKNVFFIVLFAPRVELNGLSCGRLDKTGKDTWRYMRSVSDCTVSFRSYPATQKTTPSVNIQYVHPILDNFLSYAGTYCYIKKCACYNHWPIFGGGGVSEHLRWLRSWPNRAQMSCSLTELI
jgi:hypothetical protein